MRGLLHIAAHFLVPAMLAPWMSKKLTPVRNWTHYWLLMSATIVIDLDHLLADPIYNPDRCSIGFHPLHTWWAIATYMILLYPKRTRVVGIGLLLHIVLDGIDCIMM